MQGDPSQKELWDQVRLAFPCGDVEPAKCQRKIDRIAKKCVEAAGCHHGPATYDIIMCDIREGEFTVADLKSLVRYHHRAMHTGKTTPIVLVEIDDLCVVIEGNTRVNAWVQADDDTLRKVLVVTPRPNVTTAEAVG